MFFNKGWTDQPDDVTTCPVVCTGNFDGGVWEVRESAEGRWFLTVGALSSSQTLRCESARACFDALNVATHFPKRQNRLPPGVTLVENPSVPARAR
jgi:hypothetical protein